MPKRKRQVRLIVWLMTAALAGLVAVQAYLVSDAMELRERAFQRNVFSALERASQRLAAGEAATLIISTLLPDSANPGAHILAFVGEDSIDTKTLSTKDSIEVSVDISTGLADQPMVVSGDTIRYIIESPRYVRISAADPSSGADTVLVDSFHKTGKYELVVGSDRFHDSDINWKYSSHSDSSHSVDEVIESVQYFRNQPDSGKRELVARVFRGLFSAERVPIEQRLDTAAIESALSSALSEAGIDLEFAYGLLSDPFDSLRSVSDERYRQEVHDSPLRVRLFPQDVFGSPAYLGVYFPDRNVYLWSQMAPLLGVSLLFIVVVTAGFSVTVRSLAKQRRLSALMVDFVNNMTHEFKTPISTVSLATEALERSEVFSDPDKVQRFNELIKSEALRMKSQTETILQMAALEEREIQLKYTTLDLHDLVRGAVESLQLRLESGSASIDLELNAERPELPGDQVHLTNVIHNLLDNALKYSPGNPRVLVRTFDSDNGVGVRIVDNGIGMSGDELSQAFDKYFRAPTGNVHNVKGFGIGLSYVKLLVEAHGGRVLMRSKPGEGTEVEVILPRNPSQ